MISSVVSGDISEVGGGKEATEYFEPLSVVSVHVSIPSNINKRIFTCFRKLIYMLLDVKDVQGNHLLFQRLASKEQYVWRWDCLVGCTG